MKRRRQKLGLLAAAVLVHLALLAAIPPVAAGTTKRACPLRIQLALAQPPQREAPAHTVPATPPAIPQPTAAPQRQAKHLPASASVPAPASQPATPPPMTPPAAPSAPAPADTGRIVGEGDFPAGPTFHSGGGSTLPGRVPDKPALPDGVPGGTGTSPVPATPAPALPAVDTDKLLRDYSAGLVSRIKAKQRYPKSAQADGVEGKVKLSFTVDAAGGLVSASVSSSSGSDELDSAALAAVNAAAPFAPIPAELKRSSAKLSVTLKFYLK